MARNIQLLVIDPQNDFCDLPAAWQPVDALTGQRTAPARHGQGGGSQLDAITVTLDSHQRLDIAHPGFWQTGAGADVEPFTTINAAQ
eukprot:gene43002-53363_t